jgi:hypothetical protein
MQFKQTLVRLLLIFCPVVATAQTTYLPQGDKANIVMDRWEIIAGKDSAFNFSKTKPFGRRQVIGAAENFVKRVGANSLSKVDAYNLRSLYLNNLEYVTAADLALYKSKKPILKNFYTSPANLYEVHVKDFDLVINPVIQYTVSKEQDNDQDLFSEYKRR